MKQVSLNDVFDIEYGNQLDLNKLSNSNSESAIAFVSRSSKNNGVSAFVNALENQEPYSKGLITVTLGGTYLLSSFVQQRNFYTAQNIKVLKPKTELTLHEKLYYCTFIAHNRFRYSSHAREANKTLDFIIVPHPDEVKRIVQNLDIRSIKPTVKPKHAKPILLTDRQSKHFKFSEIFEIKSGYFNKKPVSDENGKVPFVGATEYNNGITSWHNIERVESATKTGTGNNHSLDKKIFDGAKYITVSNNGSVGHAFYQPNEFTCSHDVNPITVKNIGMNPYIAMFLITLIERERYRWAYGRKWRPSRMPNSTIKLPIQPNGNPDWKFMEDYIKSLPYSSNLKNIEG